MIHANTRAAYEAGATIFSDRELIILSALETLGQATAREIRDHLELHDMNDVAPRLTELIAAGEVEECGRTVDASTGRPVRVVRLTAGRGQLMLEGVA